MIWFRICLRCPADILHIASHPFNVCPSFRSRDKSKGTKPQNSPSNNITPSSPPLSTLRFKIPHVISLFPNFPSFRFSFRTSAYGLSGSRTSSRSRSPMLRCVHWKRVVSKAHWVPFPAPGGPRTDMNVVGLDVGWGVDVGADIAECAFGRLSC